MYSVVCFLQLFGDDFLEEKKAKNASKLIHTSGEVGWMDE